MLSSTLPRWPGLLAKYGGVVLHSILVCLTNHSCCRSIFSFLCLWLGLRQCLCGYEINHACSPLTLSPHRFHISVLAMLARSGLHLSSILASAPSLVLQWVFVCTTIARCPTHLLPYRILLLQRHPCVLLPTNIWICSAEQSLLRVGGHTQADHLSRQRLQPLAPNPPFCHSLGCVLPILRSTNSYSGLPGTSRPPF